MNLGLDIDGVLYPWQEVAHKYLYDYKFISDSDCANFWKNIKHYKFNELYWQNLMGNLPLYEVRSPEISVLKLVQKLASKHNIFYITARPKDAERVTLRYLDTYKFPNTENLYVTSDKVKEIRKHSIQVYVEDRWEIADQLKKICKVYLVSQPWNESYSDPLVTKISHFTNLERILL